MGIPVFARKGAIQLGTVIRMHYYSGLWKVTELDLVANTFTLESMEGHGSIPALLIDEEVLK